MKLTFCGAARQVTGSMYLLEVDNYCKILIDCGLDLERSKKSEGEKTTPISGSVFAFDASTVTAVLLTHAHIDHSGNIPNLVREGFEGKIYCTNPTYTLSNLLLHDSASLHQRKLNKINEQRKKKTRKEVGVSPIGLYTERHVKEALNQFTTVNYGQRVRISDNVWVTFINAGHLLGAAHLLIEVEQEGKMKKIGFSGDIGRFDYPLLPDPQVFPQVDYLICESTYGNRKHQATQSPETILADVIQRTCIDKPGRLIIPAFSVGRTQALLYTLNKLYANTDLKRIKVFSDSPLAYHSTLAYDRYAAWLNEEAQQFKQENRTLFDFENLIYIQDMRESQQISNYHEPCIIISSSGMISGGRIEYHVEQNIRNPYCTIFLIGYAGENTIASELANGQKVINIKEKRYTVLANIEQTDVFSGHGDVDELIGFVKQQKTEKLKRIFLVHGDEPSMNDFKAVLEENGYPQVEMPAKGQSFTL